MLALVATHGQSQVEVEQLARLRCSGQSSNHVGDCGHRRGLNEGWELHLGLLRLAAGAHDQHAALGGCPGRRLGREAVGAAQQGHLDLLAEQICCYSARE
jgi:hypothetical protein